MILNAAKIIKKSNYNEISNIKNKTNLIKLINVFKTEFVKLSNYRIIYILMSL